MTAFLLLVALGCGDARSSPEASRATVPAATDRSPARTYVLAPSSRFDVHTETAGLLGALGHEHHVRAATFDGRIRWAPDDVPSSSVRVEVRLDDLRILTDADSDDVREIREAMEGEVLEVDRYPELTFTSTAVTPTEGGVRVTGDLTLHGETRREVVYVALDGAGDTLRASGSLPILQTDYGIDPYDAAAGTIAVADEITFDFEAVGVPVEATGDAPGTPAGSAE